MLTVITLLATLCAAQSWPPQTRPPIIKTVYVQPLPKHMPTASIVVASDFTTILSSLGTEGGFYGIKSRHSYLATFDMDYISNGQLTSYNREEYVKPEVTNGRATYAVGLKYLFRIGPAAPNTFTLVANPYYAWNLRILSGYVGGRWTYNFGREFLHGELVIDPVSSRLMIKFLATINLRK